MSKYGKEIGIPKAADQRRVDAPEATRQQKGKRRKGRIWGKKSSPYPFHNQSPAKGGLSKALTPVFCSTASPTPMSK